MISAVSRSQRLLDNGSGGKKREIFVKPFWVRCIIIEAWASIEYITSEGVLYE
jgi:hypothetical protein